MALKDAPEFDPALPHNTCYGDSVEKYSQRGFYYDTHFNPVSELPEPPNRLKVRAHLIKEEKAVKTQSRVEIDLPIQVPNTVPKGAKSPLFSLSAARGEDKAALAAEENAE